MKQIEELKNKLKTDIGTRMDVSDVIEIINALQNIENEFEQIQTAYQDRVDDIDSYVKALREIEDERIEPNKEAYERMNKMGEIARAALGIENLEN
ncbi:hypothetical protein OCF67_18240 [Bacillus wiedmannii]|uniref:hypothetical protein n=1 Tax=Bacillus wiedmannii TaxID=1890302 RepID=UPI0021CF9F02|nr:hypothetical protein [Bacillus wiedmannii]MCU5706122.1 hypothetical protein [Bacillus wiedmannii]